MRISPHITFAAFITFAVCMAVNADGPSEKSGQPPDLPSTDVQAFIAKLDAKGAAAQEARLAREGDIGALDRLKKDAGQNNTYAQYELGLLYREGKVVPQDSTICAFWLEKAGEQDNVRAQVRLIGIYEKGDGVPKNLARAAEWARRAAEQGDATGIGVLLLDYFYGRGLPRDYVLAV
jgi:TPR repeat protein